MEHQIMSGQPPHHWLQSTFERQHLRTPDRLLYKNALGARALFWWVFALLITYSMATGITALIGSPWSPNQSTDPGTYSGYPLAYTFWSTNPMINLLQVLWIALALLALALLIRASLNRDQYLCVYPQELVYCTREKTRRFALDRIRSLWCSWVSIDRPLIFKVTTLRLRMDDGREFDFDSSWGQNHPERGAIERDFVDRHLPELLEQYDRGDSITFLPGIRPNRQKPDARSPSGSLSISNTSLRHGDETLGWDMVERFVIGEDLIQIWKRGKVLPWYHQLVSTLPNACLLRELARERRLLN